MLYFLDSDSFTRQLEAYNVNNLRAKMIDELGWRVADLNTKELIEEIEKNYESSTWSFVAWNKKDAIEVLRDWCISGEEIKQLFKEIKMKK